MENKIQKLPPFIRFCYTIGMIPTSYKVSLTYEEQLVWLCNFLETVVIPTVNNNGKAVEELQALYVQLKNYVDDYFKNLDIQTEVNNKLDEMAESGQLAEIIAQYLALEGVTSYDTVSDMKEAENLVNGMKAFTFGYHSFNDGGSAYYKIRTVTALDNVNERTLIAVNDIHLVAELIIEDNKINPQKLGAYGYIGNYDAEKEDSSDAFKFMFELCEDRNIKQIELLGYTYNLTGNNPMGLPIEERTSMYQLNLNGNNATIYWDSENSNDNSLAFVGYLGNSKWENLNIRCLQNDNSGNIFTTKFNIENQTHYFSKNIFERIYINSWWSQGSCNKVFNFESDGNNSHDDLTLFNTIIAEYYNVFMYTDNNESVANTFKNCETIAYTDDAITYFIDCTNWSGHLNVENQHFTVFNEGEILVKTSDIGNIVSKMPIDVLNSRLEGRINDFKICELNAYNLTFNSLKPLSSFTPDTSKNYYYVGKNAELNIVNCKGMPSTIQLETTSGNSQGRVLIDNSSFFNTGINFAEPIIRYGSYANKGEVITAGLNYPEIIITNGQNSSTSKYLNELTIAPRDYKLKHAMHYKKASDDHILLPFDSVIETLKVYCDNTTVTNATLQFVDMGGGNSITYNRNFSNGVVNFTMINNVILGSPEKPKFLIVTLKDSSNNAISADIFIELEYRPIFYSTEVGNTNRTLAKTNKDLAEIGKPKLLWKNNDVTVAFNPQNITLSSSDYDYLEIIFRATNTSVFEECCKISKGASCRPMFLIGEGSGSYIGMRMRNVTYVNDTTYAVADGLTKQVNVSTQATVANTALIPYKVLGYKYNI